MNVFTFLAYAVNETLAAGTPHDNHPSYLRSLVALIVKRARYSRRDLLFPLLGWILPLYIFLGLFSTELLSQTRPFDAEPDGRDIPVALGATHPGAATFLQPSVAGGTFTGILLPLLESAGANVTITPDAETMLVNLGDKDFVAFTQTYILGAKINMTE